MQTLKTPARKNGEKKKNSFVVGVPYNNSIFLSETYCLNLHEDDLNAIK